MQKTVTGVLQTWFEDAWPFLGDYRRSRRIS